MIKINLMSNNKKIQILLKLIKFEHSISELKESLKQLNFDSTVELVTISKYDIKLILEKVLKNQITFLELEEWANIIECREDIGFEKPFLQDIIFQLANPYINGEINKDKIHEILNVVS